MPGVLEEPFADDEGGPWAVPSPALKVTHVRPSTTVRLRVDGMRGPSPLPPDVEDRLSLLVDRHGLRIEFVEDIEGRGDVAVTSGTMVVRDAAEMSPDRRNKENNVVLLEKIVAPIPGLESRRALFLVSPIPRDRGAASFPSLIDAAAADAADRSGPLSVVACCASELEADLFALAWASAGGGDAKGSDPQLSVRVFASLQEATDAAILSSERASLSLVVVWSCPGAPALRRVTARIRAADATNRSEGEKTESKSASASKSLGTSTGRGDASWRYCPYHPSDVENAGGRTFEDAPHQLHARAPALRFEPVELLGGAGGGPDKNKKALTLICSPAFVVLMLHGRAEGSDDDEWQVDADPAPSLLAGLVAEFLLFDDLVAAGSRLPVDSSAAAECAALAARGAVLHPRTAELVKAASNRGLSAVLASPYGRPAVPVLEQFASDPSSASAADNNIELAPKRGVTAEADGVTFRTVWYDAAGSGRGVVEASFSRPPASIDGVRLVRGDRVVLSLQDRPNEQNGTFVVIDDRTMQSPVALQPPAAGGYVTSLLAPPQSGVGVVRGWTWRFSGVPDDGLALRAGDEVAWLAAPGAPIGRVVSVDPDDKVRTVAIEVPAAAIVASPAAAKFDRDWLDPLSACSADPAIPTRQLCEAPGVWDQPCKRDADCPFASSFPSSSIAHARYRGRCLQSGRCEVPVGELLVGWRHVIKDDAFRPVCACPGTASTLSIAAASEACCERNVGGRPVFELDRV